MDPIIIKIIANSMYQSLRSTKRVKKQQQQLESEKSNQNALEMLFCEQCSFYDICDKHKIVINKLY